MCSCRGEAEDVPRCSSQDQCDVVKRLSSSPTLDVSVEEDAFSYFYQVACGGRWTMSACIEKNYFLPSPEVRVPCTIRNSKEALFCQIAYVLPSWIDEARSSDFKNVRSEVRFQN